MNARHQDSKRGSSIFLSVLRRWRLRLVDTLRKEDPLVLLGVLELVDTNEEATQGDLAKRLGISQSQVSKLVRKLIEGDYLEESTPDHDRRLRLLETTFSGRGLLYHLESELPEALQKALRQIDLAEVAAPEFRSGWKV